VPKIFIGLLMAMTSTICGNTLNGYRSDMKDFSARL